MGNMAKPARRMIMKPVLLRKCGVAISDIAGHRAVALVRPRVRGPLGSGREVEEVKMPALVALDHEVDDGHLVLGGIVLIRLFGGRGSVIAVAHGGVLA